MQRWLSFLSPGLMPLYRLVADRVANALGEEVELAQGRAYTELSTPGYDFAWVCGLPYVELVDGGRAPLTPVAAPVLEGSRYASRPVYFSDVIVGAGSPHARFEDLRGARWAYNERGSHSGYLVTLHRLAVSGEDTGFFGEWLDARYHEAAIRAVADGTADASAIDSHVLALALDREPALAAGIRVVEALGPSTIQPLVAAPWVAEARFSAVRDAVVGTGSTAAEREHLDRLAVRRLVPVDDSDYDDIRSMLSTVKFAGLWTAPRPAGLEP